MVAACLHVLNDENSIRSVNNTNMVLISKKKDLEKVYDYRSFSLCNMIYKLVTNIIANRMKIIYQVLFQ